MSMSKCAGLVWKYSLHWNRKLLSLFGSVLLKVSGMRALVPLELVLGVGVWLALRVLASQPSTLASCSLVLVLLLQWGFDRERVENVGLLAILLLVLGLVVGVSSQLGSLSTVIILGLGIGKTVQAGWIVLERDLGDEWPRWWSRLEHCGAFGG